MLCCELAAAGAKRLPAAPTHTLTSIACPLLSNPRTAGTRSAFVALVRGMQSVRCTRPCHALCRAVSLHLELQSPRGGGGCTQLWAQSLLQPPPLLPSLLASGSSLHQGCVQMAFCVQCPQQPYRSEFLHSLLAWLSGPERGNTRWHQHWLAAIAASSARLRACFHAPTNRGA